MKRSWRAVVLLLAALGLAQCGVLPWGSAPIFRMGGAEFHQEDFDAFLEARSGFVESPEPAVLSGLLDEFVREQLLILGARDAGITVSDAEVEAAAEALASGPGAEPEGPRPGIHEVADLGDDVRTRLLVQRFLDEGILRDLDVAEADLALEMEAGAPLYSRPATITLSESRFPTREEADRAAAALSGSAMAVPTAFHPLGVFREGELPESVDAAVRELRAGEFTGVLETPTGFRIFRVDELTEAGEMNPEDAAPVARRAILERRANAAMADLLAELRTRYPVTVFPGRLSFPYLGRESEGIRD